MTASLPSLADSLIQALHQPGQERLLDLVRNPLRLTLLCITWDGTLPETQAQLYENYLKKFYGWNQNLQELRDCAKRCQTNITDLKNRLNRQLGELAKAALNLPQERFRLSQALVEKYLGEELDDQSLCYLALQLGWLNRVGKDHRGQFIFAFYHATFQEYFAALTVDDWDYFLPRNHVNFPVAGKEYRIFEPQWKQVILLWLGRGDVVDEEKEGFVEKLVNFNDGCGEWNFEEVDRGFYEYHAYFLALSSISEFETCSIANAILKPILKLIFSEKYLAFEFIIENMISAMSDRIKNHQIFQSYFKKDFSIGSICFLAANGFVIDQITEKIIQILPQKKDVFDKYKLANALIAIDQNNQQAIEVLSEIITSSQDEYMVWLSASRLSKLNPQNAIASDALITIIVNTNDTQMFYKSATSLVKINYELGIEALFILLANLRDSGGLNQVAQTILTIGNTNENKIEDIVFRLRRIEPVFSNYLLAQELICILNMPSSIRPKVLGKGESLLNIDSTHSQATAELLRIIKSSKHRISSSEIAYSVSKVIITNKQRELVCSVLKHYLNNGTYESNSILYENCYNVIWNIAQDLPYPDFYRAWHHPPSTPHPEVT